MCLKYAKYNKEIYFNQSNKWPFVGNFVKFKCLFKKNEISESFEIVYSSPNLHQMEQKSRKVFPVPSWQTTPADFF
jgi:hypothetical protein